MSFDLVDKAGGEIRATAWNDQVDQFQDMIQVQCMRRYIQPPPAQHGLSPAFHSAALPLLGVWSCIHGNKYRCVAF